MDLSQALGHLQQKLESGPLVPDGEGRVRLPFAGGLELVLVSAQRGALIAEVGLGALPAAPGPREERLRAIMARALALMRTAEEVVALEAGTGRLVIWRRLELRELTPAALEEAVARLLDRAEWLTGEAAAPGPARPAGPLLFYP